MRSLRSSAVSRIWAAWRPCGSSARLYASISRLCPTAATACRWARSVGRSPQPEPPDSRADGAAAHEHDLPLLLDQPHELLGDRRDAIVVERAVVVRQHAGADLDDHRRASRGNFLANGIEHGSAGKTEFGGRRTRIGGGGDAELASIIVATWRCGNVRISVGLRPTTPVPARGSTRLSRYLSPCGDTAACGAPRGASVSASTLAHFSITVTTSSRGSPADRPMVAAMIDRGAIFDAAGLGPHVGHEFVKRGQKIVAPAGGGFDRGNYVDHASS